ncbi:MAG: META domain-containing protein [Anaerolineae bacterium]|nr:MAG: META domain-containing protein [Anaerolineae bacterium]
MKSKFFIFVALMALSSLLLSACVPAPGGPAATDVDGKGTAPAESLTLTSTPWALQAFGGADVSLAALQGRNITLEFRADNRVGGSSGCNTYAGSYTVDGEKLTFSPLISTMMACEPAVMALEQAYQTALAKTASYRIADNQLNLLDTNGQVLLTFAPLESISLEGTNWVATGVNNGKQAVVSIQSGTEITALFQDGKLSGTAGCNRYTTSYTIDGNNITIAMPASTMMMCAEPEGVMEQEQAYLAALPQAATFQIREDRLEIRDAGGALLASYMAASEGLVGNTTPPAEPVTLVSNPWVLSSVGASEVSLTALEGGQVTMTLARGQVNGSAGCNNYMGSYQVDGNQLTFSPLASTKRMCAEGVMAVEQAFLAALEKTASYEIHDAQLVLLAADGQTLLTFTVQEVVPLEGTEWAALSVNNGKNAVVSIVNGTEITAMFDGQKVGGTAGCNRYSAGYTTDGDKITIELPLSTMMMCAEPEGVMEQEGAYLAALSQAATYAVRDGQLELRDAGGALLVSFTGQ